MAASPFNWVCRVLLSVSGIKSNKVSNDFSLLWVGTGDPTVTDLDAAGTAIKAFYNTAHAPSSAVCFYLGPQCQRLTNASELVFYNVDIGADTNQFSSPVHVTQWTLGTTTSSNPQPNEVAIVLSLRAAYGTDPERGFHTRPRAQDRGRIYLGPLGDNSLGSTPDSVGSYATVGFPVVTAIETNAQHLYTDLNTAHWSWSVWSRLDKVFKPLNFYDVDEMFDTMRRRGLDDPLHTWNAFT